MTGALWGAVIVAVAVAVLAARWAWRLRKEVHELKREHYYASSRLRRIPDDIREAVQPLRVQLAKVARGGRVSRELILKGRLYHDVSAAEAWEMLAREGAERPEAILLIDVRTAKEHAAQRVPGSKLVPFDELDSRYQTDIPETAEKVFLYCAAGERSRMACDFLSLKGYTNLYNISDGLQAWDGPREGDGQVTLIQIDRRPSVPTQSHTDVR